jgi:signal transduction histidine kinase/ligand-binding sensor domain-containing protein
MAFTHRFHAPLRFVCLAPVAFVALLFLLVATPTAHAIAQAVAQTTAPPLAHPARPLFTRLGIEQGLPQNTVQAIAQDKQGFLWFGTQDGLCRYDGYSFLTFRTKKNDSTTLAASAISALLVDKKGTLWVGTEGGGLSRFDARTHTFTTFRHDKNNPRSIADDVVESLYEDSQGRLWIGTEYGGLNRFHPENNTFTAYKHQPNTPTSIGANRVYNVLEDKRGTLWVSTYGGGLNAFNPQTGVFTRFQHDSTVTNSISNNNVYAIAQDAGGTLWVATYGGGLNSFQHQTGVWKRYAHNPAAANSISSNSLRALCFDATGKLWISTDGAGVCVLHPATANSQERSQEYIQRLRSNPNDATTLSGDFARALLCDKSGIMWVGTNVAGLCYTAPSANKFRLYRNEASEANSLNDNVVRFIHEGTDDALWIGTNGGGLNMLNRNTGEFRAWKRDSLKKNTLSNDAVWTIADAPNGMLWVGTHEGLNLFNPRTGTSDVFLNKPNDSTTLTTNLVRALQTSRSLPRSLWVGLVNNGGLCRMDAVTKRCVRYLHNPNNPRSLGANYVRALLEASDGRLWVGTWSGGLCRYDAATDDFTVFKTAMDNPRGLRSNVIRVLFQDRAGTIWAGTPDGLHRLDDSDKGLFTLFTEEDGLPNNVIYSIQEDNAGNLWLGTNKGLCRFNPRTKQCRTFTTADGLQSNEFNGLASTSTRDGMMHFGGVSGFNSFHPDSVRENTHMPAVVLTNFLVYNVPAALDTAIELAHHVTVRHEDNFRIEFAALEFTKPSGNHFSYTLEGLDKRWTEAGGRHEATYTNLPPGEYLFRVRAANSDGVWNMTGRALRIVVLPPWWLTWWFRLLCVAALAAAGVAVYRWRVAYLHKRAETLQRTVDEQTHELRDANTEISRQLEILDEQSRNIELSNTQLQTLNEDLAHRNDELALLNAEKNEFLGIVSHDLKNPIGAIRGLSELIESGELAQEEIIPIAKQIYSSSERMLDLVTNLLDVNRLESGGVTMHSFAFDLAPYLVLIIEQYTAPAAAKNITLRFAMETDDSTVFADEQAVMQVLDNLISNAVKYSPQEKNIFIRLQSSSEAVRVEIQDEGPGISAEDQKKLFGKFARLSARPTGGEHSTGLGLSIVKKMVEAMNGRVWCESTLGNGATFVVELPKSST